MSAFGKLVRRSGGFATKALRKGGKLVKVASKVPGLKQVARAVPFLGTAIAAAEIYGVGKSILTRKSKVAPAGLPAISGGLPPLAGMEGGSGPGILPRGPDRKLQMPWSDPSIPDEWKRYALDDAYLKTYCRAPRGYVVIKDADGKPYALRKDVARRFKLWKPNAKPPISVGDWSHLKGANRVVKKLKLVERKAMAVANFRSHPRRTSYVVSSQPAVKRIATVK